MIRTCYPHDKIPNSIQWSKLSVELGVPHHRATYLKWTNNVVYTERQEGFGFVLSTLNIVFSIT
jgi:hypothetical protein